MNFEEAFYWAAAWYNGLGDDFDRVVDYLQNASKTNDRSIKRPDFIKSDESTPELELFWMILVEIYGDYGTSPRSGWIDMDKIGECLDNLSEIRRKTWASEFEDDL